MIEKWFGLNGYSCIVTGSSGLIGQSCVNALMDAGAKVIGIDVVPPKKRGPTEFVSLDVTNEAQVKTFFSSLSTNSDVKWGVIHSAYPRTENWGKMGYENVTLEDWEKNSQLQLGSCFLVNREAVCFLKKLGGGSVINFGSIYGLGGPDLRIYEGTEMNNPVPYSAIKAGVVGLSRYIAAVFGPHGIRSNVIAPGGIQDGQNESFISAYTARTPLRRMGRPEDIGGVAAFLISPSASYINGTVIPVDGGWTCW